MHCGTFRRHRCGSVVGRSDRRVCWNAVWWIGEIGECVGTQSGGEER
jgi:hypothetical protein